MCHTGYMDEIAGQACNEGLLKISFSDVRYFVCFCRLKNSKEKVMCTITVDIDERTLRGVNPNLSDIAAIRNWAQKLIDCRIQEMLEEDNETMDIEEARAIVIDTIRREYAKL